MGLFEQLPYTNFHELNLTELVKLIKDLAREMHDFEVVNKISYGGDWDITKQYEPWTVVCVNGTDGYISIKPVPAGVDYTNTEYWRLIADFSVQLADIGNRVSILENDVGDLQTEDVNIKNNVYHLQREGVVNTSRKILFIGDSYSIFLGDPTQNYPYIVADLLDCSHWIQGYGGAGFVGTADKTFDDLLTLAPSDNYSDIVFGGGYNDRLVNISDLETAVRNTVTHAATLYPTARIWVINMGASVDSDVKYTLLRPAQIYKLGVELTNATYCDVSDTLAMRSLLAMDGVHPGSNGQAELAYTIANIMKGNYSRGTQALTTTTLTREGTATNIATFAAHNGYCALDINYGVYSLATPIDINCDGNHPIILGDIGNTNIMGSNWSGVFGYIVARGDCDNISQHFYQINGQFRIHDQQLIFTPLQVKDNSNGYGGTAFLSLTNVQIILMTGLHIIFNGDVYIQ